jgi:hypothetical protein
MSITGKVGIGGPAQFPDRNRNLFGLLMLSNVVFNLTDLGTTLVALGSGLQEGNALVLGMTAAFGLSIFASLAIVKIMFVTAAAVVAIFGIRSASKMGRSLALSCLASSTLLFLMVSLNNVFWIVT